MSSDRETTRRVRSWLEAGVTAIPERVLDAVLDQVPATHQRRPFWPVRRIAEMNTLARLGAAAAAVIALVVAGTAFMLGGSIGSQATQPPEPQPSAPATSAVPGSTPTAFGAAVLPEFTACVPSNVEIKVGTEEQKTVPGPNGDVTIDEKRGFTWQGAINASDPRFSGTHYYSFDANGYRLASGPEGPSSFAEAHRIENADGAWQGWSFGVTLADGTHEASPVVLTGEGAYAGLSAVLLGIGGGCFIDFRGLVMDVPAPPVPYTGD